MLAYRTRKKQLMKEDKFFDNHYEEFEILLEWLKNEEE